ncbi:MAG: DUF4910 domain-containing protein [Candidatus Melainabacteria bacterium]|nr:DUF4910 domain-containing protein [Candidatus Melainabacteria bacterium]
MIDSLYTQNITCAMPQSQTKSDKSIAERIEQYFDRLWPLLRSTTGDGVRQTHRILRELVPFDTVEIPSGTQVLDWTVPKEWVVREAYVIAPDGTRILDIAENNLHILGYSAPFRGRVSKSELLDHLYSRPDYPEAIPWVTSVYSPRWGFCLSHNQLQSLPEGVYEVVVDTELVDGYMTLSEAVLQGQCDQEVLISTYTCHPSMANNELSGPLVAAFLYDALSKLKVRRLTYRFVFLAETVGCIAYLARRGNTFKEKLTAGYVVTCAGDRGQFTYKHSRKGDTLADRAAAYVLKRLPHSSAKFIPFAPDNGSDERQYCSPGFNLPVGSIMRTMYGCYKEYHTSMDNKDFISFESLEETVKVYFDVCRTLEVNRRYRNLMPFGEPQLGKRGLYPTLSTGQTNEWISAISWFLNMSDGEHDLLEIANRSQADIFLLSDIAQRCVTEGLAQIVDEP